LYAKYVEYCRAGNIRPKHKQIFSKLVFTVFPQAGSCRLGSIGNQVPYYFGIQRRKASSKKSKKLQQHKIRTNHRLQRVGEMTCRFMEEENSGTDGDTVMRSAATVVTSWVQVKKEEGLPCGGKRKREQQKNLKAEDEEEDSDPSSPSFKKVKVEEEKQEDEEEDGKDNPLSSGAGLLQRLLYLHRLLAQNDADAYKTDLEGYLGLFVEKFWPELFPLQWDLREDIDIAASSEKEMNCWTLCLCCALFCGALVKHDIVFCKEMLLLCSALVNSLSKQIKAEQTSEAVQKNFGISLLFLARGLVDCTLFQNDADAVVLAKSYCAMASEIFP